MDKSKKYFSVSACLRVGKSAAFTLVELLISVALVALLSAMLFSILDATSKLWQNNEARVDSYREARAALNFIARELSSAHTAAVGGVDTFLVNPDPGDVEQTAVATDNDWAGRLFALATLPADAQDPDANRSDLCAVGYFLAYTRDRTAFAPDGDAAAEGSYKLFRYFRSSDPTYKNLRAGDPLFIANPAGSAEPLAHNVTRFEIKAYNYDPSGGLDEITSWPLDSPPDMLELTLTALNERDAARLGSQAAWEDHDSRLHASHARTFTTRVRLSQPPATPTPLP